MNERSASPPARNWLTLVALTPVLVLCTAMAAGWLKGSLPCEGKFCSLGNAMTGALVGALVAALPVAWLAHRLRVRWIYTPALYLTLLASNQVAMALGSTTGIVLAVTSPLVAAAVAVPSRRLRVVVAIVVPLVLLVLPWADTRLQEAERHAHHVDRVASWEASGLPLWAPAENDLRVVSVGFSAYDDTVSGYYDLSSPDHDGFARVRFEGGPPEHSECHRLFGAEAGDWPKVADHDGSTVCLSIPGAEVSVRQDGGYGDWDTGSLLGLAESLEPADHSWLVERLEPR